MSFFSKLKEKFAGKQDKAVYLSGFEKSKNTFSDALNQMGSSFHGVDDDFLEQLTIVLLESDVGIELADLICEWLKKKCDEYPGITFHWAMNFLLEIMKEIYDEIPDAPIVFNDNGPTVILLEGVNGSG
ncbi:MAG: signal recognition particle receptor subunit alpha, partial [Erysipelotrichaceae bacterium]|nr:signal recognition particle receptor subunit alpha [Erysipelotrichaceae bacterium]